MKNLKSHEFILTNIQPSKIEDKFNIKIVSNIQHNIDETNIPSNTTKLTELEEELETISFIDQTKKLHVCKISMIDFSSNRDVLNLKYNCYWCRHNFNTQPLGCPIEYISKKATKKYFSHISRDTYTIKENIPSDVQSDLITFDTPYYITDGVFCSFNCIVAYILDNKKNKIYDNSTMLLYKMYFDFTNSKLFSIDPAPHWRTLSVYGGDLTIEKFRDSFSKSHYEQHGIVKQIPRQKSIGILYEEKLKF